MAHFGDMDRFPAVNLNSVMIEEDVASMPEKYDFSERFLAHHADEDYLVYHTPTTESPFEKFWVGVSEGHSTVVLDSLFFL